MSQNKNVNSDGNAEQELLTDMPDKQYYLQRQDATGFLQIAREWLTYGKKVDLTEVATTSLPLPTLIKVEGSDAPRFLIGCGRAVDLAESNARQEIIYRDLAPVVKARNGKLEVVIGDSVFDGTPPVTGVMQETTKFDKRDASMALRDPEGPFDSPFYHVQAMLYGFPDNTERMNRIVATDPNLAKLVQA